MDLNDFYKILTLLNDKVITIALDETLKTGFVRNTLKYVINFKDFIKVKNVGYIIVDDDGQANNIISILEDKQLNSCYFQPSLLNLDEKLTLPAIGNEMNVCISGINNTETLNHLIQMYTEKQDVLAIYDAALNCYKLKCSDLKEIEMYIGYFNNFEIDMDTGEFCIIQCRFDYSIYNQEYYSKVTINNMKQDQLNCLSQLFNGYGTVISYFYNNQQKQAIVYLDYYEEIENLGFECLQNGISTDIIIKETTV